MGCKMCFFGFRFLVIAYNHFRGIIMLNIFQCLCQGCFSEIQYTRFPGYEIGISHTALPKLIVTQNYFLPGHEDYLIFCFVFISDAYFSRNYYYFIPFRHRMYEKGSPQHFYFRMNGCNMKWLFLIP